MKFTKDDTGLIVFECPGCGCLHFINNTWKFNGDFERPTVSPSILVNRGRSNPAAHICHSFIKDGMIQFLHDCTHDLAGKTVELPEIIKSRVNQLL